MSGAADGGAPADGTYDVIVVDAASHDDGTRTVEVAVLAGHLKGEVLSLRTTDLPGDDLDLLGVPGTLVVAGGAPDLRLEG